MPYASGLDILHQIHDDPRLMKVPVIVTMVDMIRAKSLEGQVEAILIKPVSFARLRDTALRLCPLEPDNDLKTPLNP
jgi:CheY-like chemotaxis protein